MHQPEGSQRTRGGTKPFSLIGRLVTWAMLAVATAVCLLSVLVLLRPLIENVGEPIGGPANVYAAWFMALVTFLTFGVLVMLPLAMVVVVCWTLIARRAPRLEKTLAGVAVGTALVSLTIACVSWMLRRGTGDSGVSVFPVALFLACWCGLLLPRWKMAYLRPGILLLAMAMIACGDGPNEPIAGVPAGYRLSAKNGVPIAQAADVGCEGVLAGTIAFTTDSDGRSGLAIVSHVVRDRVRGPLTLVDMAYFKQLRRQLLLAFPAADGIGGVAPGVAARFAILDDATIETSGGTCYPGDFGAIRDVVKVLRYSRVRAP